MFEPLKSKLTVFSLFLAIRAAIMSTIGYKIKAMLAKFSTVKITKQSR